MPPPEQLRHTPRALRGEADDDAWPYADSRGCCGRPFMRQSSDTRDASAGAKTAELVRPDAAGQGGERRKRCRTIGGRAEAAVWAREVPGRIGIAYRR